MTIDERVAGIHPLLPEKLRMDEEEWRREGNLYKLFYEKTYGRGSKDCYESSVKAANWKEAVDQALKKLQMLDMMARWDTNITDAFLIGSDGQKFLVPPYSKELRGKKADSSNP